MSTLDGLVQQNNDPQIMDFWVDFEKKKLHLFFQIQSLDLSKKEVQP